MKIGEVLKPETVDGREGEPKRGIDDGEKRRKII